MKRRGIIRALRNNIRYTHVSRYNSEFVRFAIDKYARDERATKDAAMETLLKAGLSKSGLHVSDIGELDGIIEAMAVNRCHTKQKILCDLVVDGLDYIHLREAYMQAFLQ